MVYKVSSRTARATHRNPVSKKQGEKIYIFLKKKKKLNKTGPNIVLKNI
jgi:hypothetical protein